MSRSHNLGAYVKNVHPNTINDKSRASLASMDVKMQTAIAGAANPTQAQIVLAHGDTGSAIVPLAVDASGHLEVNFSDEGGLNLEATQQLVLADTTAIATDINSIDGKTPAQGQALMAASVPVAIASDQSAIPVTSSGGALATEATLLLVEADTTTIAGAVSGTEMQVDIVDRGGVATEVKQPALGTAGTASADVITMQGIAGMTAVVVDGSAVTQPVSATALDIRALVNSDVVTSEQSVRPVGGSQANMWSAATPGVGGKSTAVDTQYGAHVDIFGNVDGACTLSVEISQDNATWYASQYAYSAAGAEDFHISFQSAARYFRLDMDSGGVQVTATGCFKA